MLPSTNPKVGIPINRAGGLHTLPFSQNVLLTNFPTKSAVLPNISLVPVEFCKGEGSQGVIRVKLVESTKIMQVQIWSLWGRAQHREYGGILNSLSGRSLYLLP